MAAVAGTSERSPSRRSRRRRLQYLDAHVAHATVLPHTLDQFRPQPACSLAPGCAGPDQGDGCPPPQPHSRLLPFLRQGDGAEVGDSRPLAADPRSLLVLGRSSLAEVARGAYGRNCPPPPPPPPD